MPEPNKKLCCFVTPYFGKLPLTMPAFLKTAEKNPGYNWLIFTDDRTEYPYPENVSVRYCTFEEMMERVQKCFDFKIAEMSSSKPMKFMDFRPAFGHIFADELQNFEFWGYCDLDEYFGDLSKFIPREFLCQYDRLFSLGTMTIYRNTEKMRFLYQSACQEVTMRRSFGKYQKWETDYREVFSSTTHYQFEELGINLIAKNAGGGYVAVANGCWPI